MKYLSNLFIEQRKAHNYSMYRLGDLLDVSAQFICRLEKGQAKLPPHRIKAVAQVFNITEQEIIDAMVNDYKESISTGVLHESC